MQQLDKSVALIVLGGIGLEPFRDSRGRYYCSGLVMVRFYNNSKKEQSMNDSITSVAVDDWDGRRVDIQYAKISDESARDLAEMFYRAGARNVHMERK